VEAERQEKKLNQELIRQNEQLQQFLYITSHNLRGPVATLLGLVDVVDREDGLSAYNRQMVGSTEKTVKKLDTVIRDLNMMLEYKKELGAQRENVSLQSLTEEVSLLLARFVTEAGATIETVFAQVKEVFTVRAYLHSIFYNLLSNAIKYRDPGRLLLVCVRSHQENGYVCITFSDNGLGIDLDRHQQSLFGLYKRFHLHVEGKGLGLHLVKTQVEALNGSVAVESQEGKGSTFTVKLPIQKP
jgi:signal transduction histidine kinase